MNADYIEVNVSPTVFLCILPSLSSILNINSNDIFLSPAQFVITRFYCMSIAIDLIQKQYIG